MAGFTTVVMLILATTTQTSSFSLSSSRSYRISSSISMKSDNLAKKCSKALASTFIAFNLFNNLAVNADDVAPTPEAPAVAAVAPAPAVAAVTTPINLEDIPKVKLLTQRAGDTQAYSDVGRGFRMLRYSLQYSEIHHIDIHIIILLSTLQSILV
jgi:hypothetical protein